LLSERMFRSEAASPARTHHGAGISSELKMAGARRERSVRRHRQGCRPAVLKTYRCWLNSKSASEGHSTDGFKTVRNRQSAYRRLGGQLTSRNRFRVRSGGASFPSEFDPATQRLAGAGRERLTLRLPWECGPMTGGGKPLPCAPELGSASFESPHSSSSASSWCCQNPPHLKPSAAVNSS